MRHKFLGVMNITLNRAWYNHFTLSMSTSEVNCRLINDVPLIITIFKLRTLCSPQYHLRSALPGTFFPLWKNGLKYIYSVRESLQFAGDHKEPKFIVANIILVKVATQHRSLSDRASSLFVVYKIGSDRSSLQESKTLKSFPT